MHWCYKVSEGKFTSPGTQAFSVYVQRDCGEEDDALNKKAKPRDLRRKS